MENTWTKRAWVAVSLAVAALLSYGAARNWVATNWLQSRQLRSMERGAALEPGNANGWDRLGRLRQEDFGDSNPRDAIADFQRALADYPRCPYCWTDLGDAYDAAGEYQLAEDAFQRAEAAYPASAEVAWLHGNFLLRQQEYERAFAKIQRATERDRAILPLAISRAWRATGDVNEILDHVIPQNEDAYLAVLDFFTANQQMDAGLTTWHRLIESHESFVLARAFPFLTELIREDRSEDARNVWLEALAAAGSPLREEPKGSLISDGQFMENFADGGLGWRWDKPIGADIDFDLPPEDEHGRSLRVEFSGGVNMDLAEPTQFVSVEPSHRYLFSAKIRTEDISTESGMRFALTDPHHPQEANVLTDNLIGTHAWMTVQTNVDTGPDTHFLEVRLFRPPSRMVDGQLAGTAWLADVALTPENAETGRTKK